VGVHDGLPGAGFVIAEFRDARPVAYQETAVRGQVIEDDDDVSLLASLWDKLRAEALRRRASLDLVEVVRIPPSLSPVQSSRSPGSGGFR
jgi:hypothetical protein